MRKLVKELEAKKKTTTAEKCLSYRLDKVRSDDRKLPFQLLKDVPGILSVGLSSGKRSWEWFC